MGAENGSTPDGWSLVKLGDLGEVNRGRSRHRPRYAEHLYVGPYPFIQTGDIKESGGRITRFDQTYSEAGLAQSRLWPAETMCITIAANIAETAILTFSACFPDSVVGFIADNSKCDVYFVEYMFRYLRRRIQHEATGSAQDNINLGTLDRLRFPIPPLAEQKAIASILGALDDKIELNRRMNATLEAMARAIFKSWFVDFDPVRAKMDGKEAPGLSPEIAALFPNRLVHTDDGELIPEGWEYKPVSKAFEVNPPRHLSKGEVAPYLDMKSMPTSSHHPDDWTDRAFNSGTRFVNGDTLVARITPCLENGKTAFVDFLQEEQTGWGSTEYIVLRPRPPLPLEYGYYLARSDDFRLHAITNMTGSSGRQRVPTDCFDQCPVAVPPDEVASEFSTLVRSTMTRIKANCEGSRILAATRDALLPKLLAGEFRLAELEVAG